MALVKNLIFVETRYNKRGPMLGMKFFKILCCCRKSVRVVAKKIFSTIVLASVDWIHLNDFPRLLEFDSAVTKTNTNCIKNIHLAYLSCEQLIETHKNNRLAFRLYSHIQSDCLCLKIISKLHAEFF